jgi:hypothetical protein
VGHGRSSCKERGMLSTGAYAAKWSISAVVSS